MSAAPSMVDVCLSKSLPAQLVKPCHPFLSLTPTPIRSFHLSCSASSSPSSRETLSLRKKASFLPFVARTSDWKQEDLLAREEEEEEEEESGIYEWEGEGERTAEEEVLDGVEAGLSEWEEEDEKGGVGTVAEGEATSDGEPYQEPPEGAKLFVGNLPYDMDSEKLAQLFDQAGVVEVAEVVYNRETDRSRGFGFVTMSSIEEADKATEMFNRQYVEGRGLTVNKAAPRGSRLERAAPRDSAPTFRIYVGNLPWSADDARLEQVFSEHGKVVDGRVVYDRESGRSRGFGFVTMSTQQEMDDAIAALDGQNLDGRTIRVNAAEERPRRPSF